MPSTRTLPELDDENRFFWTSGADGRLRFLRCRDCAHFVHPPRPVCPACRRTNLAPEPVSGEATVATFTINHQRWTPTMEVPFAVAIVELPEQRGLRLTTNLVECPHHQIRIGMPVRVRFEQHDDVWLPLFAPAEPAR